MNITETERKVFSYIEEHHMIAPYDKIVAGISGGADSVCLLFLLLEYAREVPFTLAVVHVNHGVRQSAGEDARYVEELCRQKGLTFFLTETDVPKLAGQEKCSQEDMGRRVRYEAFRQAAEKLGGARTAVAHNSNDNAETMLFHLFRGSGLKGLCGIAPVRDIEEGHPEKGQIIRPILCLERREIEDYLRQRKIAWCTDDTNGSDDYSRNRIRHHILPYAEQELVTGTVEHMRRTAELLRETETYLEQQTREALESCLAKEKGEYQLDVTAFLSRAPILQKRMLLSLARELSPTGKDIALVHIRDVMTLFEKEGSRSIDLPFGIRAKRQYGKVILERASHGAGAMKAESLREWHVALTEELFASPCIIELDGGTKIEFQAFFLEKGMEVPKNQYTKWFDYDKIGESLEIRFRRQGDFFTIADGTGDMIHKSLKDYMITEKIPKQLREEIPVAAVGNHIVWLTGWRISEYYKTDRNTKRILQVIIYK